MLFFLYVIITLGTIYYFAPEERKNNFKNNVKETGDNIRTWWSK